MALLERVSTLVRANLNDLIDRAESPEKMVKQVMLDMQNQFMQVKTQVAMSIADLHLLEKKKKENDDRETEWMHKAELAVEKKKDDLARAALDRAMNFKRISASFDEQIADQRTQVEILKTALQRLEQKIAEVQSKSDLLLAQHRRSRTAEKAGDVQLQIGNNNNGATLDRVKNKVLRAEAIGQAKMELSGENVEESFAAMEKEDEIERLLQEIKGRKALPA
jgi:phage shock protein A